MTFATATGISAANILTAVELDAHTSYTIAARLGVSPSSATLQHTLAVMASSGQLRAHLYGARAEGRPVIFYDLPEGTR